MPRLVLEERDKTGQAVRCMALGCEEMGEPELARTLSLLERGFERWPPFDPQVPPAEHLRWKMEGPFADLAALWAEIEGELVASVTVVTQRAKVGDREFPRTRYTDYVVAPELRGRGIAGTLEGVKARCAPLPRLRLSETWAPALMHLGRKRGARPVANPVVPLIRRVRRMPPSGARDEGGGLRDVAKDGVLAVLTAWNRLRFRRTIPSTSSLPEVRAVERPGEPFDRLWQRAKEGFDVSFLRTSEYLDWRYADRRGGRSTIRVVQGEDELLGYSVLKTHQRDGRLVDLLVLPGRSDVVRALAADAVATLSSQGVCRILSWLPLRHPYRNALRSCGFVDARGAVSVTYTPGFLTPQAEALLERRDLRLHYTLGDSDFV